jgi:hypothetical protein
VTVDYTITMPGYILQRGLATVSDGSFSFEFDPQALNETFPNLDLAGRDDLAPGLADTISISLLLQGTEGAVTRHKAATVVLQGEQVFSTNTGHSQLYLPAIINGQD